MATEMNCRCDASHALTTEQRRFASENHALIFAFLNEQGLDVCEYYDVAALGYLSAVRRYLTHPELCRHAFSTIAWRSMRRSIASFQQTEAQRAKAERSYSAAMRRNFSIDELEVRLFFHDLASVATPAQYELAVLRIQDCSIGEAARQCGITSKQARKLLRELYQAYFQ